MAARRLPASTATSASRSAARSSREAVKAYAADPDGFDRAAAVEKIARNYLRFIEVYEGAPAPA